MWALSKEFRFEASHKLPDHDGKCARLHGHSWRGVVNCRGDLLFVEGAKTGMLIDYGTISNLLKPIVDHLDHWHLNDQLAPLVPTSENIARWVYQKLQPQLGGLLFSVVIEETCTSRCEYFGPRSA